MSVMQLKFTNTHTKKNQTGAHARCAGAGSAFDLYYKRMPHMCHYRCDTLKNPSLLTIRAEHRSKYEAPHR